MSAFEDLLTGWDGEQVAVRYDAELATWMFIGVHSTRDGRSGGGTRMAVYARPEDALADALKLSAAMTRKMAVCDVAMGGGKAVLAVPSLPDGRGARRAAAPLRRLHHLARRPVRDGAGHEHLRARHGHDRRALPSTSSAAASRRAARARPRRRPRVGVFHGIEASVAVQAGPRRSAAACACSSRASARSAGCSRRTWPTAGAEVLVSDVDAERVAASGFAAVDPEDVIGTECDVYAPCAIGGVIDAETVERLRCSVVAGAANNQLADPALADRLHERGILYAPDYVINSGGVLHGAGLELLGWDQARLDERLRGPRRHAHRALRRQRPLAGPRRRGAGAR